MWDANANTTAYDPNGTATSQSYEQYYGYQYGGYEQQQGEAPPGVDAPPGTDQGVLLLP